MFSKWISFLWINTFQVVFLLWTIYNPFDRKRTKHRGSSSMGVYSIIPFIITCHSYYLVCASNLIQSWELPRAKKWYQCQTMNATISYNFLFPFQTNFIWYITSKPFLIFNSLLMMMHSCINQLKVLIICGWV